MQGLLSYLQNELPVWLVQVPVILIVITVHEYAHAWIASKLGDTTPSDTGRLSLNPLKHLDPLGTVALLVFHVGWARPVLIDFSAFKHPRRDTILVSLAGPLANFVTALAAYLVLLALRTSTGAVTRLTYVYILFRSLVEFSVALGVFNLLPIPPLDGSKVVIALCARRPDRFLYDRSLDLYGTVILLALLWFRVLDIVVTPVLNFILNTLLRL